jgi:hypothetical protein
MLSVSLYNYHQANNKKRKEKMKTIETTPEKELLRVLNKNLKISIISCTFKV